MVSIPVVFYFRKNFYLTKAIDRKIEKLQTAGLIDYWTYDQVFDKKLLKSAYSESLIPKPLKIRHLRIAFQILWSFCLIALGIFGFEIICVNINFDEEKLSRSKELRKIKKRKNHMTQRRTEKRRKIAFYLSE
jgi:hypothetical protein